jgi:phospholipid/cholesterol/gamma-HCH transport system permease protein
MKAVEATAVEATATATAAHVGSDHGDVAGGAFHTTGALALRTWQTLRSVVSRRCDLQETLRLTDIGLRDIVATIGIGAAVIGGIVGLQGLGYLTRYSASEVFGWAAALSAFRDVGPTLLAFAIAARLGTKNAAETAKAATTERLDAIAALGKDPADVVFAPRVVAMIIIAIAVYPPAATLMLVTGFAIARVIGDQNVAVSAWSVVSYATPTLVLEGAFRMGVFGLMTGVATTQAGAGLWLRDRRGASDVGAAVYGGSVMAVSGIVVVNLVLSLLGGTG